MRNPFTFSILRLLAAAVLLHAVARASDHADPMSLNVLMVQESPEANITDLHAFTVDSAGKLITDRAPTAEGDQLIISLCVRRALRPDLVGALQLKGYKFQVHLDFQPPVRIFDETKTRAGKDYATELAARKDDAAARGALIAEQDADRSQQALYGGIISPGDSIAGGGLMEFELDLVADGEQSQATIAGHRFEGIAGTRNIVTREKSVNGVVRIAEHPFQAGAINIEAGVFDDPFIFPRFFRRNIVGIVTSIPLVNLVRPPGDGPILLWATTHGKDGKQIDHVGRSLRTQLPRFGYLNEKTPAEHVKAITRVHDRPGVMEDVLATFLAPLEAHRHYDSVPDVMVFDLSKPARFPNGRALTDDVGGTLAAAGETLLAELSYAESKQFPRATKNDKPFRDEFPYLALRWTAKEVMEHAAAGSSMAGYAVPRAPDGAAIASPNLRDTTWRTLWFAEVAAIVVLTILLLFTVRSNAVRIGLAVVAFFALCLLHAVFAANLPAMDPRALAQPSGKACRLLLGGGLIGLLKLGWFFALGRRSGSKYRPSEPFPPGDQGLTDEDRPVATDSYDVVKAAVFSEPYYGAAWGGPDRRSLPIYKQTLATILPGILPFGKRYAFLQAARRTVRSRADLRWGPDRKGFRRLLHPMGICLTGTWKIDAAPEGTAYTGYFAKGAEGRIIGRYSLAGSKPAGGNSRSLALVGKIYPPDDPATGTPGAPAHFFTQEDLGANFTNSIREAILTNSPPVSPWNRGKDVFFLIVNGATLFLADNKNSERQLYEIAELGKPAGSKTSCPRFMKLTISPKTPGVAEKGADFRDEILSLIYDRGNPVPQRKLVFDIEVSDLGKKHKLGFEWLTDLHWMPIGSITFDDAAASYNGDFVIHYFHPPWRTDRNDPSSVARVKTKT